MASRKHLVAMLPRTPIGSRKCGKRGQKPGRLRAPGRPTSPFLETKEKKNSLKMRERSGNVYENKRPLWEARAQSWDVGCGRSADPARRGQQGCGTGKMPIPQCGIGPIAGSPSSGGPYSKIRRNEAGMSMKIKDRCGKLGNKAGMSGGAIALTPQGGVSSFGEAPKCRSRDAGSALRVAAHQVAGRTPKFEGMKRECL